MDKAKISQASFWLSVVAVVLSAAVSVFQVDLWLAGTQWMLIGIVLAVWALFLKS